MLQVKLCIAMPVFNILFVCFYSIQSTLSADKQLMTFTQNTNIKNYCVAYTQFVSPTFTLQGNQIYSHGFVQTIRIPTDICGRTADKEQFLWPFLATTVTQQPPQFFFLLQVCQVCFSQIPTTKQFVAFALLLSVFDQMALWTIVAVFWLQQCFGFFMTPWLFNRFQSRLEYLYKWILQFEQTMNGQMVVYLSSNYNYNPMYSILNKTLFPFSLSKSSL